MSAKGVFDKGTFLPSNGCLFLLRPLSMQPCLIRLPRCIGSDAYRFGGVRLCCNKQLRTDLVDEAVWEEVCRLLEHPERLEQEYRRRLLQQEQAPDELSNLETRIGRLRQGIARLIDSYADGLIDKVEFEPRIARMRERLKQIEEQAQHAKDEASLERELTLILGRLDEFTARS